MIWYCHFLLSLFFLFQWEFRKFSESFNLPTKHMGRIWQQKKPHKIIWQRMASFRGEGKGFHWPNNTHNLIWSLFVTLKENERSQKSSWQMAKKYMYLRRNRMYCCKCSRIHDTPNKCWEENENQSLNSHTMKIEVDSRTKIHLWKN